MGHGFQLKRGAGRPALLIGAVVTFGAASLAPFAPAAAQARGLSGGAYGHYTNVGLFGGPPGANGPAPVVTLPATGADPALTASEQTASAVYGPAKIFGGKWPPNVAVAPGSGPITVSTKGKTGPGGYVTSTADIVQFPKPLPVQCEGQPMGSTNCTAPGGFGPNPPTEGDELHSTCTADAKGVTGSTRFVKAILSTATDADGNPINEEPVPDNPPVNYTRTGQLTNVGDNYRIVYNEQIKEGDGITVNAVHIYLLGPIAIGESILGQVRCSAGGAVTEGPSTTQAPATSAPSPTASAPQPPADEGSGSSLVPIVLGSGGALVAGAVGLTLWARSRRRTPDGQSLNDPP